MLENGQNLNFAVPSAAVNRLIAGEVQPIAADVPSLLDRADSLMERIGQTEYSEEPNSEWQKFEKQINATLEMALSNAGNDHALLLKVAEKAEWQNSDIAITAADRAVHARSSYGANLILGKLLTAKARTLDDEDQKVSLQTRAEQNLRSALRMRKQPDALIYYHLADLLEDRKNYGEADTDFQLAYELSKKTNNTKAQADSLRGLTRICDSVGRAAEAEKWFDALVNTGLARILDWQQNGHRLDRLSKYEQAGDSFRQAAVLGGVWSNWCEAAGSYSLVAGKDDETLFTGRKCISEGTGKADSERRLAYAHDQIATILNKRGVYQEALSHAREAIALDSTNSWAFYDQAKALLGLRRFQESINASIQAIRLSDGKFATMHFALGSAYFEAENWEFARQSFQKASELDSADDAAPYNVALCLVHLGYYGDAATWYEEVLRRNPKHVDRQDILNRIQGLRR
jgi:tetratricopeptide (TPR) repeat protein